MNIDFILKKNKYDKLLKEIQDDDEDEKDDTCLISQTKIVDNMRQIKLPCGHVFDYVNLFNEIKNQKYYFYKVESGITNSNSIKCPYCRKVFDNVLPYHEIKGVERVKGINYPNNKALALYECQWKFKTGKNKGKNCTCCANKYKNGLYCDKHHKMVLNHEKNKIEDNRCCAILKTGKRKGFACGCKIHEPNEKYCKKHKPKNE